MSQKLTFTTADMRNTAASNATDAIYYDIQTPEWEPHVTTVRRLDPRTGMYHLTGRIRNEGSMPTEVGPYGRAFEPVEQWLKEINGNLPGESRWQFDDGEGNAFSWTVANQELELHSVEDKIKRPLATFYQHKRYCYVGMISQHAYLEVDSSATESVDAIMLSLLIVERKRRAGMLV